MGKRSQGRRRTRRPVREVRLRFAHAREEDGEQDGPSSGRSEQSPGDSPGGSPGERLSALLGPVLEASESELSDAVDRAASGLAEPADGWPAAGRALLVLGDQLLGRLWSNGWQPADLERIVRRELTARHTRLVVDLIASEARRYPAAGLPVRWAAQLAALDARPGWDQDDGFLPAAVAREKADRFSTASAVFELLRLLCWLPPIKPVGPAPGHTGTGPAPAPEASASAAGTGDARMLDRIRALLAKAESTEYPEEAEALTAKAQQLMARHSIDHALLAAESGGRERPEAIRIGVDAPYEGAKAALLNAVATANRCRVVWSQSLGFCTVLGFPVDLESVELLYTSLLVQATAALNQEGAAVRGGSRKRSFRQSFLVAYAERIAQRLSAAASAAEEEYESEAGAEARGGREARLLPALAARDAAVRDSTERMFPELKSTRAPAARDYAGWIAGQAAADRAQLGSARGSLK
jgi:hypothetical protein